MKRILGLDLGVSSIGWAVIETPDDAQSPGNIVGIGSRILLLEPDESSGFTKGKGETKCRQRTTMRQARRQTDRRQQRRKKIGMILEKFGMNYGDELKKLSPYEIWELRSRATSEKLSLPMIGRVITHINARRGYKHAKEADDDGNAKKKSDYLSGIASRAKEAADNRQTPGQYFFQKLKDSAFTGPNGKTAYNYRVKEKVFPRYAYENELLTILRKQSEFNPDTLTTEAIGEIFNAVFYQRPLKSCKHLVSICEFEGKVMTNPLNNHKYLMGPRVAPVSSPISQTCRLWEAVNNIKLENARNKRKFKNTSALELPLFGNARIFAPQFLLTDEERHRIFDFLNSHKELKANDLLKIVGLKKDDGFSVPANISRGLKGNDTRNLLDDALGDFPDKEALLKFNLKTISSDKVDTETGEVLQIISPDYLKEPLYQLWHTVYSISDRDELASALEKKFGISDPAVIDRLFSIDFRGKGFSNKSAKFMCKLIPYLEEGLQYSEACEMAGKSHSGSLTKEENECRELSSRIELLSKGSLRQPIVEKVLNQMIMIVNAIIEKYGQLDEIRVELARELKKNQKERQADFQRNAELERKSKEYAEIIQKEFGLKPSKTKIQKYRLWVEAGKKCFYCGQTVNAVAFLSGIESDREHIIPRSLFFDDSFSNKVCSCRACNATKGQKTAYDFMSEKEESEFREYLDRVEEMYDDYKKSKGKSGISKTKHDRLLTARKDIPQDFVNRDLRQTQYISRKAMELLREVCRNVYASSGSVTDFFRHAWGYDTILEHVNLPRYSEGGMTEFVESSHKGESHTEERIPGWTKRLDHRHHAIDALTVALTRQGYIQRLNTLNAQSDADDSDSDSGKQKNLEKWAAAQPHFKYADVEASVNGIAVSFKSGNKFTSISKRFQRLHGKRVRNADGSPRVCQSQIIPRQALTEQTIYGMIRVKGDLVKVKNLFLMPDRIFSPSLREAVKQRLSDFGNDVKKAQNSIKKNPIILPGQQEATTCGYVWEERLVSRCTVDSIKFKNVDSIVDKAVRDIVRKRFAENGNDDKKFAASLNDSPLCLDREGNRPILRVKCFAALASSSTTPVRRNESGENIGYAKFGNNHHIALYLTPEGKIEELVVPYIHAVKRKQLHLPVVVEKPDELWDIVNDINDDIPEEVLSRMPMPDWKFIISFQRNDMLLLGLQNHEIISAVNEGRKQDLLNHLFRVQILSSYDYRFRRHTDTTTSNDKGNMGIKNFIRCSSYNSLESMNPVKVKVDRLGNLILPKI